MSAMTTCRPLPLLAAAVLALVGSAPVLARGDTLPAERDAAATQQAAQQTAQARQAVDAYLALWSGDGRQAASPLFSDKLVLAYDHASPRLQGEVRGGAQAVRLVQTVAQLGTPWQFRNLRLFPTAQRNQYVAQYTASGTSRVDGSRFEQNVVLSVELDGRQLVRLTEYTNPALAGSSRLAAPAAQ